MNSVEYDNYCYATMDYLECSASALSGSCPDTCQSEFMELPAGWELAPYSEDVVREVVAKYDFGTYAVVFSNGQGYGVKSFSAGTKWGADLLAWSGSYYKVKSCARKVLMRRFFQGKFTYIN